MRALALLIGLGMAAGPSWGRDLLGVEGLAGTLLRIDPVTGMGTPIGSIGHSVITAMAWDGGTLWATSGTEGVLLRVNPQNDSSAVVGSLNTSLIVHGLAYDSAHHVMYALGNAAMASRSTLLSVDLATGGTTVIGLTGAGTGGDLAYDAATDTLFMSHVMGPNELWRVDRSTDAATLVGPFGTGTQIGEGMTFDPTLGPLASDNQAITGLPQLLYRVNAGTGAATLIGQILPQGDVLALAAVPSPGAAGALATGFMLACRRRRRGTETPPA